MSRRNRNGALACALALTAIVVVAQARAGTVDGARRVVCPLFGARCAQALAVGGCETGGTWDVRALGKAGERGWFQIHPVHFGTVIRSRYVGSIYVDKSRLYDPRYNARVAYVLSDGGRNWQPWTCRSVLS